ncbi:hypothetical protein TYRP_003337 [Tyrophagus putrescentiae]|nr:hypothetical protein TYRP_003337 [Tyrophagus putrescentiae]
MLREFFTANQEIVSTFLLRTLFCIFSLNIYIITALMLKSMSLQNRIVLLDVVSLQTIFLCLATQPMIVAFRSLRSPARYLYQAQLRLNRLPQITTLKIKLATYYEVLTSGEPFAFSVGPLGKVTSQNVLQNDEEDQNEQRRQADDPTPNRLQRIGVMISTYESTGSIAHPLQQRAVERLHEELDRLWNSNISEEAFRVVTELMNRSQRLLSASSERATTLSSASIPLAAAREKKPIDIRGLLHFDGSILDYPRYRADMHQAVMSLSQRTDQEKYMAICRTLDRVPLSYLGEIDHERPDLGKVWQLLDKEYLSGVNVEDALRREIQRHPHLSSRSLLHQWISFLDTARKLQRRVEAGNLSSSSDRALYHVLLTKLTLEDRERAALRGGTLSSLVMVLEEFVNRARVQSEKPEGQDRPRDHRGQEHRREASRVRAHTVTPGVCLFCGKGHAMRNCLLPIRLKFKALRRRNDAGAAWPIGHLLISAKAVVSVVESYTTSLFATNHQKERGEGTYPRKRRLPSINAATSTAGEGPTLDGRVFLDSGSTDSFISESFAVALGADLIEDTPRVVHAFGGGGPTSKSTSSPKYD